MLALTIYSFILRLTSDLDLKNIDLCLVSISLFLLFSLDLSDLSVLVFPQLL